MTLRLEPLIVDSSPWACCSSCRSRSELELIPIESLDVIRTIYRLVRLCDVSRSDPVARSGLTDGSDHSRDFWPSVTNGFELVAVPDPES